MTKTKPVDLKKLADLETKANELQDKLARSLADYSNLEKRIESQRQMFVTLATVSIVTRMIEVLDDLYLSYNHLQDQGLKMTLDKFLNVLKAEGVAEIEVASKTYDPQTMEVIATTAGEENLVLDVRKKGYTLNGQVIRPAQVVVGKKEELKN